MLYANALNIRQTVAPTVEPITTAEAKSHLRIDTSDDDTYIDTLIETARQYVESYTGRAMVERTYRADLPIWSSEVILPFPPLISVSSVKYYDADNAQQTWASTNYEVDTQGGRILLAADKNIPNYYNRHDAWQVTYVAGYESTSSPEDYRAPVPEALKSAMKLLVGDLYENRESSTQLRVQDLPTIQRILDTYRTR